LLPQADIVPETLSSEDEFYLRRQLADDAREFQRLFPSLYLPWINKSFANEIEYGIETDASGSNHAQKCKK
jgi:hypothetical protein